MSLGLLVSRNTFYIPVPLLISTDSRAGEEGAIGAVDHAVIGGVVAVVVFAMLCLLIILGRYFARHKGKQGALAGWNNMSAQPWNRGAPLLSLVGSLLVRMVQLLWFLKRGKGGLEGRREKP